MYVHGFGGFGFCFCELLVCGMGTGVCEGIRRGYGKGI